MGGFWLSASLALAYKLTWAAGAGLCVVSALMIWTVLIRPAAWHDWQLAQVSPDVDASAESSLALACISQSAGMADAVMLEKDEDATIFVSNMVLAGVFIA